MANTIDEKVMEIIAQQLDVSLAQLRPETSLKDDLNADSVALVGLTLAVEQEFRLSIPDADQQRIRTVGDLIVYVNDNVNT